MPKCQSNIHTHTHTPTLTRIQIQFIICTYNHSYHLYIEPHLTFTGPRKYPNPSKNPIHPSITKTYIINHRTINTIKSWASIYIFKVT